MFDDQSHDCYGCGKEISKEYDFCERCERDLQRDRDFEERKAMGID